LDKELAIISKRRGLASQRLVEAKNLAVSFGYEDTIKNWQSKTNPLMLA